MKEIYMLSIVDSFQKTMEKFKDWIIDHYDNPIMWVLLFLFGLLVFQLTFSALQKEK